MIRGVRSLRHISAPCFLTPLRQLVKAQDSLPDQYQLLVTPLLPHTGARLFLSVLEEFFSLNSHAGLLQVPEYKAPIKRLLESRFFPTSNANACK